jgi:feruloyl esterase
MKIILTITAPLLLAACASQPPGAVLTAAEHCARIDQAIPASAIALPTRGARIESATLVPPSRLALLPKPPFSPAPPEIAVIPAAPEYCQVIGAILPVDPQAPPIRFQVNLPTQWNHSSLQFGGGGFNGTLITGLALPPSPRPDKSSPLSRGFVTYGTDSGHQNAPGVPLQAFALNEEALTNFAYAAYKKVHDVAVDIMQRRYGAAPRKLYFMGSSEGGREGLTMAQRFPNDFDGIFSRVPVINWVGLQAAGTRVGVAQFGSGWLSPAKVKLVHDAVLAVCDARDGAADGIVSDYLGCRAIFDVTKLRCPGGGDGTTCLNDSQVKAVQAMYSPYTFKFPLANGMRAYPGWGRGGEGAKGGGPVGGWESWQTGTAPPTLPPGPTSSRAWLYGSGAVQYFFTKDGNFDPRIFDPDAHANRIREISAFMDSTNPDLSMFYQRGGKLIISVHMADYAQSPYAGIEYHEAVVAKMGRQATENFLRLYVTPGADHMGMGAPSGVDMLEVLVNWVERDMAPGELVQVTHQPVPPFAVTAARTMCRYPKYPHYVGGDQQRAESYVCRPSNP